MRVRMTVTAVLATLAGSAGLHPLFTSGQWFWAVLGAVPCAAAGGLLMRRLRFSAAIGAAGGLAALLLYLTAVFAHAQALLWVVPTPGSLRHLVTLGSDGWRAVNQYAAPVPLVHGITLLVAAGVGLVAVLVDLLAVRLRRAALAGLPLLAMYSVPAAVREEGVSWLAFGAGALGFLMLLTSDAREQVGGWGRAVFAPRSGAEVPPPGADEPRPGGRVPAGALAASGRRIGAAAVAIAVLVPLALPGLHPKGVFGRDDAGGGSRTVTTPDPLVSLKRELTRPDDSVVLTYRTTDAQPDYLRLYALDRFDGDRWTYDPLRSTPRDKIGKAPLPAPPGMTLVPTRTVRTRVAVRPEVRRMTFLPVPYAPARVSVSGDWRVHPESLMVYSLRDSASGRAYTVDSVRPEPTAADLSVGGALPAEIVGRYTAYPKNVPAIVRNLADKVTAGASSSYQQAVRLQRWFTETGGFTYDLSAPPPQHGSDLLAFLVKNRRGYCEQFAASMALMARILGIPARVAMGYTPGTEENGRWVVRSRDAHAWPELYFPGAGWIRFEPTPSGIAGQGTAVPPDYTARTGPDEGDTSGSPTTVEEPSAGDRPSGAPSGTASGRRDLLDSPDGTREEDDRGVPAAWIGLGVLVLLLLAAPTVVRVLVRRRRWAAAEPPPEPRRGPVPPPRAPSPGAAHTAWREVRTDALDHGLPWLPNESPRATARRLTETLELPSPAREALGRIAMAEELARYSRSGVRVPRGALRADVRTVRAAFAAAVPRRARWRARMLPPSALETARDSARASARELARLAPSGRTPGRLAAFTATARQTAREAARRAQDRFSR
ncbi:Protein-glutamine gamma-glutamyltransferase [Actinomadura rubteroloni]|uniref:Protein-glutamine gamma-glutamyltransferase n=1 Tax=Actinomadura rubteroloni TaxID=1926885 RepID=A0A2P4UG17_9ACTN|nr:DUF3488 and transglutaminase-like domain-containing protein [Actinomadura rubteroloni]POM24002.1 Protein-glutamine gamma-glutamyltransferase [Actinomadura rubteroloni]